MVDVDGVVCCVCVPSCLPRAGGALFKNENPISRIIGKIVLRGPGWLVAGAPAVLWAELGWAELGCMVDVSRAAQIAPYHRKVANPKTLAGLVFAP